MSPTTDIYGISTSTILTQTIQIPIKFYPESGSHNIPKVETLALIDSGAGGIFIDKAYQQQLKLPTNRLSKPIKVHNVDGTRNKTGQITKYIMLILYVAGRCGIEIALVTGLGRQKLILGTPWLKGWNPNIDWKKGCLSWRDTAEGTVKTPVEEPKSLKSLERNETSRKMLKNSEGRSKTFRETAIMSLWCCSEKRDKPVEGYMRQTVWGLDDRIQEGIDDLDKRHIKNLWGTGRPTD